MRTNPTICLDCGQSFVGTTECPTCHRPESVEKKLPAEDDPVPEAAVEEEREVVDTPTLLNELRGLGFKIR